MSDYFCPLPWIQVSIKPSGVMTTCCVMKPLTKTVDEKEERDIQKKMKSGEIGYSRLWWDNSKDVYICGRDSLLDVLNSDMLKDVRVAMLQGKKHPACDTCWKREGYSKGKVSVRINHGRKWKETINPTTVKEFTEDDGTITKIDIKNIELRFGNHCNLKCVMCHPGHSNLWYKDWNKLKEQNTFWTDDGSPINSFMFGGREYSMDDETPFHWYKTDLFKEDFMKIYSGLHEIYWAGGEPLLCKEHIDIINLLLDSGVADRMRLRYDSNITYIPDDLIDKWKQFKWVGVQASVDDIGGRNDYIRYPSKWDKIATNLKKIDAIGPYLASSGTTISCYNTLTFLDFAKWGRDNMSENFYNMMHFKHVIAPFHLCANILPRHVKLRAIEKMIDYLHSDESPAKDTSHWMKIDMFKNFLMEELDYQNEKLYEGFIQHTKNVDELRTLKFRDCFPELYEMIKGDF